MAVDTTTAAPSHPEGGEGGGEAVRPLLSGAPAEEEDEEEDEEEEEELDIRYAPYARRDAYGPLGRGPLSAAQVTRLVLAGVVLLPLRLVAGVLLVVAYYLVCRVCTLFAGGVGEGRPRLQGLRREAVLRAGRVLSRAMLFVFGFYWIPVSDRSFPNAEHLSYGRENCAIPAVTGPYQLVAGFRLFVCKCMQNLEDAVCGDKHENMLQMDE